MKKLMLIWIVFIVVSVLTGLVFANPDEVAALKAELAKAKDEIHDLKYGSVPPIIQQIKPAPVDWKGAYGDTKDTQLYFNARTALFDIEQCKRAIRLLAATMADITNPDDPNSLVSRIAVLESLTTVLDVRTGFIENAMPHKADKRTRHQSPALKPDDPKEVAEWSKPSDAGLHNLRGTK